MILRRVLVHMTNQNWTAVGVELFVVVVGVFVGLQASNWNDGRVERARERGYIVRLHEDITESANGLRRDINSLEDQLTYQASLLSALNACDVDEENAELVQLGLMTLGYVNPPRFSRRTVNELAASGRLEIVQSTEIKAGLAKIVATLEYAEKVQSSVNRRLEHHLLSVQDQVQFDLSKTSTEFTGDVAVIFDIKQLCQQPRNASAISAISFISKERLDGSKQLLARYLDFLPILEIELKTRWDYEVVSE